MQKLLAVMAHPDDEVLGCGGTIARFVKQGVSVRIIICGEGLTSRGETSLDQLDQLDKNLYEAAKILGVSDVHHLDWPDNRFDSVDLLTLVQAIESLALPFAPDVVITHHFGDLNIDHRYVHEAVLACFRPLPGRPKTSIYSAQIASSSGWAAPASEKAFIPNTFFDISTMLETKVAAMAAYQSESTVWPHPRSAEAIRTWAKYWGSQIGLEAAEPFVLVRNIL